MNQIHREGNTIFLPLLSHPKVVNDLLCTLFETTQKKGYSDIILDFQGCDLAFPNVCAPLAGILEFYRLEKNIKIEYRNLSSYLADRVHLLNPVIVGTAEMNRVSSLDTVWKFTPAFEIKDFATAFAKNVSQTIVCEPGLLHGLELCIHEVMDNVFQHASPKIKTQHGYIMAQVHKQNRRVAICVYDYGQGIMNSLKDHPLAPKNDVDAITFAIKERVTRDKIIGQGNGLWVLQRIVQHNGGLLTILSGKGCFSYNGEEFLQNSDQIYIDQNHKSTTVDFQLNCDRTVSIEETLNGYSPTDHRIEAWEDDQTKSITYRLKDQASGTGTRQSGERIRYEILNLSKESSYRIVIDFDGVSVVSLSFADELIGKLVVEMGFTGFTQRIQLTGMNDFIKPIVDRSVAQRIAELFRQ